jgi:hypothetical protein
VSNESTIAAALTSFLRGKGFSPSQTQIADAGALGNLQAESGFSPSALARNDGGPGVDAHGIAQWEGGRYSGPHGLQAYASKTGGNASDLRTQIGFLESELSGPKSSTLTALKSAPNASAAALDFATGFEGNNPSSDGTRESNATSIFGQIRAGTLGTATAGSTDTSGGVATVQNASLTSHLLGGVGSTVGGWILKGVLVAGGLGIIGLGLFRASAPARNDAKQALSDAAPLAAAAA